MRKIIFIGTIMSLAAWALSCKQSTTEGKPAEVTHDSLVKRGRYLVTTMGCDDCHTPKNMGPNGPMPDLAAAYSGHPASAKLPPRAANAGTDGWVLFSMDQTATVGPWGVSYAANISSDSTGIGMWSEQQFFTAMRKGKWKGLENARDLMPPMPWRAFAGMTDEDLRAMFTFLKSTRPVKNIVPAWEPPSAPPPPPVAAK